MNRWPPSPGPSRGAADGDGDPLTSGARAIALAHARLKLVEQPFAVNRTTRSSARWPSRRPGPLRSRRSAGLRPPCPPGGSPPQDVSLPRRNTHLRIRGPILSQLQVTSQTWPVFSLRTTNSSIFPVIVKGMVVAPEVEDSKLSASIAHLSPPGNLNWIFIGCPATVRNSMPPGRVMIVCCVASSATPWRTSDERTNALLGSPLRVAASAAEAALAALVEKSAVPACAALSALAA